MDSGHSHGYKVYFSCWLGLLGLTVVAMGVGQLDMPTGAKAFLLVGLSIVKVLLIATYFMHLRFEKKSLVFITTIPLMLAVLMWFMIVPDTLDTGRRTLTLRDAAVQPAKVPPGAAPRH